MNLNGGTASFSVSGTEVLVTSTITASGNGALDLADNNLIVTGMSVSSVAALQSGYAGGAWNGPGIRSSTAAATPGTAIGYGQASTIFSSFPTAFAGQSVTSGTEVLARYTLRGDANLDRLVNVADFNILAADCNGANTQFTQGNFNFDATVNAGDFNALATEYGMQTAGDWRSAARAFQVLPSRSRPTSSPPKPSVTIRAQDAVGLIFLHKSPENVWLAASMQYIARDTR